MATKKMTDPKTGVTVEVNNVPYGEYPPDLATSRKSGRLVLGLTSLSRPPGRARLSTSTRWTWRVPLPSSSSP